MDKLRINGNWRPIKGRLKKLYRSLSDDDLLYEKGKELELILHLQQALRRKRADIVNIINYIADSYENGPEMMNSVADFDVVASEQLTEDH